LKNRFYGKYPEKEAKRLLDEGDLLKIARNINEKKSA